MLTVNYIKENLELAKEGLGKRHFKNLHLLDDVISKDEDRKMIQYKLDTLKAELNSLSKEIGNLYKEGKNTEAESAKEKTIVLKEKIEPLQEKYTLSVQAVNDILYQIPNIPHASVKAGKTEADNEVVFESTHSKKSAKGLLPHWEIAKKYNLIDFEMGVKITGAGFPVYIGKGAKLQRALIQFFLDRNTEASYQEVIPPFVVNEDSAFGTGQLPDKEGQMYFVNEDKLFLIPTSEVPVTNMYRDNLLKENDLPILHTAYSPCFRREAGSYGKEVRGLNRLHQFEKVEIVRIEKPENSYAALDAMVEHVKDLLEDLGLKYRILRLSGGDTSFASALTYDFEIWSAVQERWLEVSSVSNFETFQANRLKLRYKSENGNELCHTLNGSALALPRVLAGILENHQDETGILIPEKLKPYTNFDVIN